MKKYTIILIVAILTGCATTSVTYDYDKSTDFTQFKTYAFTKESLKIPVNQLNLNRIIKAVENEMSAKGYTSTEDNPDVGVDLYLKTEKEVEATATTMGAGYGPYRYGWGAGMATTNINYNEYTNGSLFISIIEMDNKKLIWQGIGTKTLDENLSTDKRDEAINSSVQQIMANFPPQAKE